MARRSERFAPPKRRKKKPLTADQEKPFYQAAQSADDLTTELCGRILMDFGLRVDELVHMKSDWIATEPKPHSDDRIWAIRVPQMARCSGGVGETGSQNASGADLHHTSEACYKCRTRTHEKKTGKRGWLTEQQAEEWDFHPKTKNSVGATYSLETTSCDEAADLLNSFLEMHGQFPIGHQSVRNRLSNIAERAEFDRDVAPHALRHTYGCRLASGGSSIENIMRQMRHGDRSMAKWYSEIRGVRQKIAFLDEFDPAIDY